MPAFISTLLQSRWFVVVARIVLTFVFWSAGLAGIFDFGGKTAEMRSVDLAPAEAYAVAVTALQLVASLLIIINRYAWVGAGTICIFLALTIPIAHPFWTMQEPQRAFEFYVVLEHVSLIGGLMVAAAFAARTGAPSGETVFAKS